MDQEKFQELIGNEALPSSIWLKMDELPLVNKRKFLQGLLAEPISVYPSPTVGFSKRKNQILFDAARSKPKLLYNEAVLRGLLGLEKYLTTSTLLKVFNYFLCTS